MLALGVVALVGREAAAQGVVVAPHAVFIDHRTRSGSVLLYNPNTEPAEVTISLIYGVPVTDSLGDIKLDTVNTFDAARGRRWRGCRRFRAASRLRRSSARRSGCSPAPPPSCRTASIGPAS
jgi:hypothetical protein